MMIMTPAAAWREAGQTDPHGQRYNCQRHELPLGELTDDEMANAVFMFGNAPFPSIEDLRAGKKMGIIPLTPFPPKTDMRPTRC